MQHPQAITHDVRPADAEDVARLVEMGRKFHAASPYAEIDYNAEAVAAMVASVMERGALFVSDGGMIGGLITPLMFNPDVPVAVELFWWAEDGSGRALREAFEVWAHAHGAIVQLSVLDNEHTARLGDHLRLNGYRRGETSYLKGV